MRDFFPSFALRRMQNRNAIYIYNIWTSEGMGGQKLPEKGKTSKKGAAASVGGRQMEEAEKKAPVRKIGEKIN